MHGVDPIIHMWNAERGFTLLEGSFAVVVCSNVAGGEGALVARVFKWGP